jgi:rod shape-determining protein MreD
VFAAFVQGPVIRLLPIGILLLSIQRTLFTELQIDGVIVQVVLAFVVTAGAVGGSERGAIAGFVLGAMFDLVEGLPLGTAATAMTLAGVVAGLLAVVTPEPHWWLVSIAAAVGAVVGELGIPAVRAFVGIDDPWDPRLWTIVPVVAIAAALLAPMFAPVARWALRIERSEWKAPPETGDR